MGFVQGIPIRIQLDSTVGADVTRGHGRSIVLCFDGPYSFYAQVTIASLLKNTKRRDFDIDIIAHGLSATDVARFHDLGRNLGAAFRIVSVDYGALSHLQTHFWWTPATYLRWFAPSIVRANMFLYLDCDLIVEGDISELFACVRNDLMLGGVEDGRAAAFRRKPLGLADGEPFLNSGVMLVNAELWREANLTERAISFAQSFKGELWGVDQDVTNVVASGCKYYIPEKWNVQTFTHGYYGLRRVLANFEHLGILHFSGEVKPWMRWADPYGQRLYLKYASYVGVPPDFWIEPRTLKEQLLLAESADESGDAKRANAVRRQALQLLLNKVGSGVLETPIASPKSIEGPGQAPRPSSDPTGSILPFGMDLDHLSEAWARDPHSLWDKIRETATIPRTNLYGGVYLPTRYRDIKAIASDPTNFSSRQIVVGGPFGTATHPIPPMTSDPPVHAVHRLFLKPYFAARNIDKFRAIANATVQETLGTIGNVGQCDVVHAFSLPYVTGAIADVLGILPSEKREFCQEVIDFIVVGRTDLKAAERAMSVIQNRLAQLILRRIVKPDDDLTSQLVSVRHQGKPVPQSFLVSTLRLIILAGIDTTASVISHALFHLADADERTKITSKAVPLKTAIEEFIRISSPAMLARRSMAATSINGCPIATDSMVLLPFAAANRDPAAFDRPHAIQLDRKRNNHLAFGFGIHQCLGMHLARVLIGVGLEAWIERFPSYRLREHEEIGWSSGSVRGMTRLVVTLAGETADRSGSLR